MRRKLFLLSVAVERSTMSLPLAAGILKAELDAAASLQGSLETQLLDLTLADSSASAAESVREPGALVGVSAYLWNETWLLDFARSLRSALPGAVLFAGGPQAQAAPAAFFEAGYSFVAAGDGEALIVPLLERLLRGETPSDLPGILTAEAFAALSGAAPGSGFAPVFLDDLGGRPSPFLSGSLDLLSHPGVLWETTRGCPYSCAFCYESRGRKQVRLRPLETLEAELALFAASGVRRVFVLDPSFNVNRKRALEVLGLIARTAPELSFTFEIRGEALDEELAEAFARIGSSLQIGLQSSDPEVLRQVDRDFNSVRFTEGCSLLREAGAVYGFDLIYGLPGDSFEGFLRSLDFALGLVPANLDVFPLAVLPGTVLADKASSLGLAYDREPPFLVRGTQDFPQADLERARLLKAACDELYTRRKAAAWFLVLTEPLGLRPSEVLLAFAAAFDSGSQEPGTEAFLERLYRERGREGLFPAARSYLRVASALGWALEGQEALEPLAEADLACPETRLVLAPGVAAASLDYDPYDLEALPDLGLEAFAEAFTADAGAWLVYAEDGEPAFERLTAEEAAFFAACDGRTPLADFPGYGGSGFAALLRQAAEAGAVRKTVLLRH